MSAKARILEPEEMAIAREQWGFLWPGASCLTTTSESESELLYDWRFTANQFVLVPSLLRLTTFFFVVVAIEPLQSKSLCNILSDERISLSLLNMLGLCQAHMSHLQHDIENSSFYSICNSSVSPGISKQIMPISFTLCYNSSLVT
jgi:hypothetical protein